MIIFEGLDGSGKTTLIDHAASVFNLPLYHSNGPMRNEAERDRRLSVYATLEQGVLVDRHPMISGYVYRQCYPALASVSRLMWPDWRHHLVIYCKNPNAPLVDGEQTREWDTPEYIASLHKNRKVLAHHYDVVMSEIPHIVYCWSNRNQVMREIWQYLIRDIDGIGAYRQDVP